MELCDNKQSSPLESSDRSRDYGIMCQRGAILGNYEHMTRRVSESQLLIIWKNVSMNKNYNLTNVERLIVS